jgi:energy-coupling factor transporter transmembrane protein EcfT
MEDPMRARTLVLLVVLTAIGVFAAVNWKAIVAPTTLSLVVADVQAPLGLIMLSITVLLTVLFLLFLVYLQTSALLDTRRHTRELQTQRELADKAEASRFTELQAFLEAELRKLAEQWGGSQATMAAKLDKVHEDLGALITQTENSLSAYIGELDDRVQRTIENAKPGPEGPA